MNMAQITGEAIHTERPMERAGCRLSPARMATYSSPHSAPKSICPKSAMVRMSAGGVATLNGVQRTGWWWISASVGRKISAAKTARIAAPPMLWIHLPQSSPRSDASVIAATQNAITASDAQWFSGSHAALGPIR